MAAGHRPVMLQEAIEALALGPDDAVVDATFGGGGHSRVILDHLGPGGNLIGIDRDPEAAGRASDLMEDPRFEFVPDAYDGALWVMVGGPGGFAGEEPDVVVVFEAEGGSQGGAVGFGMEA